MHASLTTGNVELDLIALKVVLVFLVVELRGVAPDLIIVDCPIGDVGAVVIRYKLEHRTPVKLWSAEEPTTHLVSNPVQDNAEDHLQDLCGSFTVGRVIVSKTKVWSCNI